MRDHSFPLFIVLLCLAVTPRSVDFFALSLKDMQFNVVVIAFTVGRASITLLLLYIALPLRGFFAYINNNCTKIVQNCANIFTSIHKFA